MASVPLSELHAGAKLSTFAAAAVVRVPPGPATTVSVLHPRTQYCTATFPIDAHNFAVTGREDEGPAGLLDVVLNGASASAGDIFLRLDRHDKRLGDFVPELEVLACRHCLADVNAMAFDHELQKALGDRRSSSFFLFVTSAYVHVDLDVPEIDELAGEGGGGASSGPQTRSVSVRSSGLPHLQRLSLCLYVLYYLCGLLPFTRKDSPVCYLLSAVRGSSWGTSTPPVSARLARGIGTSRRIRSMLACCFHDLYFSFTWNSQVSSRTLGVLRVAYSTYLAQYLLSKLLPLGMLLATNVTRLREPILSHCDTLTP